VLGLSLATVLLSGAGFWAAPPCFALRPQSKSEPAITHDCWPLGYGLLGDEIFYFIILNLTRAELEQILELKLD
jgi:hypothetical protein